MISISLCMIVKNEENVLEQCLSSVHDLVDEIIIIDTGSTDNTRQIAEKFTKLIYDFEWVNDFSAARNFSFSKATKEYQMWLDADDIFKEEDREKFKKLKAELTTDIDTVALKYNYHFDANNIPTTTFSTYRIFKTEKNFVWKEPVHEVIASRGNSFNAADIYVTHTRKAPATGRNIKIYEEQIANGQTLSPRSMCYYARELRDNKRYKDAVFFYSKFLNDKQGWVEDIISACFERGVCYSILGEKEKALESFLKTFRYDTPRAESCCHIAYYFKSNNNHDKAIFWFAIAATLQKPTNSLGYTLNDYWGYIPNVELAIYYTRSNNVERVIHHTELAKRHKQTSDMIVKLENYINAAAGQQQEGGILDYL